MPENQEVHDDRVIAYALLRIFMGVNIGAHGIGRLLDPSKFRGATEAQFAHSPLPHAMVIGFALTLPWVETAIGALIFAGLWTRIALMAGALVMIALTFGSCLVQDWQVAGIQLSYQIAYFILLFLHSYDRWSLDTFLRRARSGPRAG
jgi:thiosulfate dehydrogenase (quinone) large subunit